jgi:HAD superfamily hydrolase (TIGR01509 family)
VLLNIFPELLRQLSAGKGFAAHNFSQSFVRLDGLHKGGVGLTGCFFSGSFSCHLGRLSSVVPDVNVLFRSILGAREIGLAFLLASVGRVQQVSAVKLTIPTRDYAAYIFDCDGTLANTMPVHYRAWVEALHEFNPAFHFEEDEFYRLGGVPTAGIVELFNQRPGIQFDVAAVVDRKEHIFLHMVDEVEPIHAVVELARQYHAAGKPLAVASGGAQPIVQRTLGLLGITDLFRAVVTPEYVKRGKPAPDLFLLAAEKLGAAPLDCLVFEDTPTGQAAAEAAGMDYVLVPSR